MTREEKNQIIDELKVTLSNSNVFYLTDTSALDAEATSTLRRKKIKKGRGTERKIKIEEIYRDARRD